VCELRESKAKPMHVERGRRRSGEKEGDKDRELARAPAIAGRQTGHRGLYLGRWQARAVRRDGAGGCCGVLAASRSDDAVWWRALRPVMAGRSRGSPAAAARRERGEEERDEEWASAAK
jgi:hypothetical protein